MVWAISTDITFCVSKSCESAVIENAPTSANAAIANTKERMWGIGISSKHRRCDESRILQASPNPSQSSVREARPILFLAFRFARRYISLPINHAETILTREDGLPCVIETRYSLRARL